ncbi:DMT family transporter [Brevibacillus sp. H7]|uniref:DMT family transporter n=1 Tax=Brevibacillus sp. H7 TaxID=3349138 RepID=UPI00382B58A0
MTTSKQRMWADISLFLIAVAWGYTFVLTKDLLEETTPFYFTGTRFLLAALILCLIAWKQVRTTSREGWVWGWVCGVVLCAAFTLQIIGIKLTTPGKAGVITGTNVILVPIFYYLWRRVSVQKGAILGSVLAFIGLVCLSGDGEWASLSIGDGLVFLCAVFFALHILLVDFVYTRQPEVDSLSFVMIQLLAVGIIDLFIAVWVEPVPGLLSGYGWFAFLFDCLIGTMLAYIVQIKAQQYLPPARVSLLLSFEAVFAFLFSWLLWGEPITAVIAMGIGLMLLGIFVTEWSALVRQTAGGK